MVTHCRLYRLKYFLAGGAVLRRDTRYGGCWISLVQGVPWVYCKDYPKLRQNLSGIPKSTLNDSLVAGLFVLHVLRGTGIVAAQWL
jgi:hypothetical protein